MTPAQWYLRHAPGSLGKARLADRVDRALQDRPRPFSATTRFGAQLAGTTTDLLQRYVYAFGVWEPNLTSWMASRLRPGDTFVDVGANIGYFSLLAAPLVRPGGTVVAIEASPSIFAALADNVARNPDRNVRVVNVAACDTRRSLPVWLAGPAHLGATTTADSLGRTWEAQVEGRPLPEILSLDEQRGARLIKIDVEGSEAAVVRGLMPLLAAARPDLELVVEVNGSHAPVGDAADDLIDALCGRGFHLYEIPNDYAPSSVATTRRPARPIRCTSNPGSRAADLVFSPIDAPHL